MVAAKNHDNGLLNPNAQFRMKVSVEDVLHSVMVADPLRLLDCSPITDGAAAVVLAPADMAAKIRKGPVVKVLGSRPSHGRHRLGPAQGHHPAEGHGAGRGARLQDGRHGPQGHRFRRGA